MPLDFTKSNGLVPAIIQDNRTLQVLMLGYMNESAFRKTKAEGRVTFFSRSKNRLWTKGETSGNYLLVEDIHFDCDQDAILIMATPLGPTCHTGSDTCFQSAASRGFVYRLEQTIAARIAAAGENSYTSKLYRQGINKIAKKVGEEAVELIIEAKDNNPGLLANEAADLLYHFLVLLQAKGLSLAAIEEVLQSRSGKTG